jgi:hypothetical protein
MKNLNRKYFLALAVMCVLSLSVFAYTADIAGKYTGSADIEGAGTLAITAEIVVKEDKISGSINSDAGTVAITGGSYADNKVSLTLDVSGDAATMSGTVGDDGKITGDVSGAFKGTFQMTRDKATR